MELKPKKSLGQHFLNNTRIPKRMADAAGVHKGDTILEVGPGTGVLTRELLERDAWVVAIEADTRAVDVLHDTFKTEIAAGKLTVIKDDARTLDLVQLGLTEHTYKVVANIPYYLSGKLLRTFLQTDVQPSCIVFLIQKEVAGRIATEAKESLLSLSVKTYGEPRYIATVSRRNFTPPPQVDSAIIAISNISHNRLHGVDESLFFKLLHLGFASKRKQLVGNLSRNVKREELSHIFSTLSLPLSTRAEELSLEKWLALARETQKYM